LRPIDGTRQIEKFAPRPFYIAATKGNVDLTRDIDDAISKINMTDPYYESRLFTQHFGNTKGKFWLSDGEKNYISQKKTVNVLVLPQLAPFATVDRNGEVGGISRFILEKLRADTGLDMNFITVENIDDMPERIKEGDIDIVYGVSNDIIEVHKFGAVMSQPYIRVEMAAFYNSNSMAKEKSQCILATSEDSALIKEEEYKGVHHYTSVEECVKAVNGGRADVGFANSYSVDFYSMNNRCTNLQVVPVTGSMRTIGFGVVDPRDIQLLSIINKRVRTIGEDEIDGYLLQEVEKLGTNSPANFIKSNMALAVGTVSIFLFAIVTAVTFAYINVLNKRKNAQLSEAYAVAKKANQAKTEFLARMSHEMRTPLSAVIGMTNIARDNVKDEQQLNNSLDKIDVASEHLLQIINDVLDMTKINEGKLKLRIAPFDFKQMMRSLEVIYKGYAKENNISLECKLDDRISDFVMGDALRIKQIVINLLSNAVKYNVKNGMVELSATITEQNDTAQTIRISVKDTGIGISKESKKIIFEAFERAQAADEGAIEGTGLGLSISQKMAKLMDSKIEVESEPMGGSNFYLDVTLLKCSGENIAVSREKGEQLIELNGKNIMVVDDNSINVMILEKALNKLGAHVVGAQDGKQAVEKFQQSAEGYYSAIFMDIRMPVLGGYEATKQIRCIDRADGKTVKIVAVSANAFADDIDKSLDSGMDAHLAKPIDSDKLYSILKNIVQSDDKNKA
ncbi:MAG: ATP-binding protein, partial [Oscillospiraceae bacterium]